MSWLGIENIFSFFWFHFLAIFTGLFLLNVHQRKKSQKCAYMPYINDAIELDKTQI